MSNRVRKAVFPDGHFNAKLIGRDASEVASAAGIRVPTRTRVLVAPIDLVVPEEPLAHEKLLPVLAFTGRGSEPSV